MTPEGTQEQSRLTPYEQDELRRIEQQFDTDQKEASEASKNKPSSINSQLLEMIESTERRQVIGGLIDMEVSRELFAQDARLARVFALSGAFADIKGTNMNQAIALAMTKIRLGRSWGISEADAMQFIYFNNGRPSVMSELLAAKLYESGMEWDIRRYMTAGKCTGMTLFPKVRLKDGSYSYLMEIDPDDPDGKRERRVQVSFTKQDADNAKIWEKGKQIPLSQKWNYESWAEDMYFARCIVRIKRRYRPGILRGAITSYEADEMQTVETVEQPASNIEKAQAEIQKTEAPDKDPRWKQAGSAKAAREEADKILAKLEAEKAEKAANIQANGDAMRHALLNRQEFQEAEQKLAEGVLETINDLAQAPSQSEKHEGAATGTSDPRHQPVTEMPRPAKPQFGKKGQ